MQGLPTLRRQHRPALPGRAQEVKQPQPQHRQPMMAASLGSDSSDCLHAGAANPAPAAAPSAAPEGARTEAAAAPAPAQAPAGAKTEAAGGFVTTQWDQFCAERRDPQAVRQQRLLPHLQVGTSPLRRALGTWAAPLKPHAPLSFAMSLSQTSS